MRLLPAKKKPRFSPTSHWTLAPRRRRLYARGVRYEYKALKALEADGYYARRTAGSHGLFDIMAFNREHVLLISVKSGTARLSPAERRALLALPLPPATLIQLWSYGPAPGAFHIQTLRTARPLPIHCPPPGDFDY